MGLRAAAEHISRGKCTQTKKHSKNQEIKFQPGSSPNLYLRASSRVTYLSCSNGQKGNPRRQWHSIPLECFHFPQSSTALLLFVEYSIDVVPMQSFSGNLRKIKET